MSNSTESKLKADDGMDDDEIDMERVRQEMPLPEGVLEVNLGIPVIIACTKSDLLLHGDKA